MRNVFMCVLLFGLSATIAALIDIGGVACSLAGGFLIGIVYLIGLLHGAFYKELSDV